VCRWSEAEWTNPSSPEAAVDEVERIVI
jgi:hypothetical protein